MRWEYASISANNKHVLPEGSKSRREKCCRSCVSTHSERARFLAECYVSYQWRALMKKPHAIIQLSSHMEEVNR